MVIAHVLQLHDVVPVHVCRVTYGHISIVAMAFFSAGAAVRASHIHVSVQINGTLGLQRTVSTANDNWVVHSRVKACNATLWTVDTLPPNKHRTSTSQAQTLYNLHAANVHAALHGDGMCDSLIDARHVRVV